MKFKLLIIAVDCLLLWNVTTLEQLSKKYLKPGMDYAIIFATYYCCYY